MNYQVLFVTNLATVSEDSLGASAVGLGLANKVYVLLSLRTADPNSAESFSVIACTVWSRPKDIKYMQQGHNEPLNN